MAETFQIVDIMPLWPEIVMALGAMTFLMMGVFGDKNSPSLITTLAVILLVVVGGFVWLIPDDVSSFHNVFIVDSFTRFMKILTLTGSICAIGFSASIARHENFLKFETPVLIVLATLGMMMMISANDMIALYLGLELQALSLYILTAIKRDSLRSTEAGLKYFVLGALSSGLLLYGMSFIYGFSGHTGYEEIAENIHNHGVSTGLIIGLVFVLAGIAFKISAAPFHMWTPDVYEGAPTATTAFLATAPKVAAMAVFIRIIGSAFEGMVIEWQQILVFLAILSMVIGAFAAIGQHNIKRLIAYSSIGNMGFALAGVTSATQDGVMGSLVYITIYLAMTLGVFALILSLRRAEGLMEQIEDLAGLSRNHPLRAAGLMLLMFSLAGIPPLAGFWAKWYVLLAVWGAELYVLAIIGVLSSVVAAFYYLRIIKVMYFDEPAPQYNAMSSELKWMLGLSCLFVIGFVLFGDLIIHTADSAAAAILL